MENSEAREKVISLGKLIVEELDLHYSVNTLGRWMAHYLSEKIVFAEQAVGDEKERASQECFQLILNLWSNRSSMPDGTRPFESYEPIFNTLMKLSPDGRDPFFYRNFPTRRPISDNSDISAQNEDILLGLVQEIDVVARIWINYLLKVVASSTSDERTQRWIDSSLALEDSFDSKIIFKLIDSDQLRKVVDGDKWASNQIEIDSLERRLSELEKFSNFHDLLVNEYRTRLEELKSRDV